MPLCLIEIQKAPTDEERRDLFAIIGDARQRAIEAREMTNLATSLMTNYSTKINNVASLASQLKKVIHDLILNKQVAPEKSLEGR